MLAAPAAAAAPQRRAAPAVPAVAAEAALAGLAGARALHHAADDARQDGQGKHEYDAGHAPPEIAQLQGRESGTGLRQQVLSVAMAPATSGRQNHSAQYMRVQVWCIIAAMPA